MRTNTKYRIYKAMIGWNVVCPCGGWMGKSMTFAGAVALFQRMIKEGTC